MFNRIPGSLLVRASLVSLTVLAVAGCATGMGDPTESAPTGGTATNPAAGGAHSLADALSAPAKLNVAATGAANTGSAAFIEAEQRSTGLQKQLDLNVLGGTFDVRVLSDGELHIDQLSVDIDSIQIPASVLPPNGLALGGIAATLAAPVSFDGNWSADGNSVTATVSLDLSVNWGIERADGSLYPLSPVRVSNVPVAVKIKRSQDGTISAEISGTRDGVFYDWAQDLDLSNLAVDFRTADPAQP